MLNFYSQTYNKFNFGDAIALLIYEAMQLPINNQDCGIDLFLVGSMLTPTTITNSLAKMRKPIFFGTGLREARRISKADKAEIFAVRGLLSSLLLEMPNLPLGDSAFLLKKFYKPNNVAELNCKTIVVPHMANVKIAEAFFANTDYEIISPLIDPNTDALRLIIDKITSAQFVVADSLHAGIICTIYDIPFCFYNMGMIDIPFKYIDFASSLDRPFSWCHNGVDVVDFSQKHGFQNAFKRFDMSPLLSALDKLQNRLVNCSRN